MGGTACGFIGKVADFEPKDSYGPEPASARPPAIYPIAALSFRVAKTMPEIPHEYVVRTPENEAAYVALFNLIVEHGVHGRWRGRRLARRSIQASQSDIRAFRFAGLGFGFQREQPELFKFESA